MSYFKKLQQHYVPRFSKDENAAILDWENKSAQYMRFKAVTDNIELQNKRFLDVGSGLGDFLTHCENLDIDIDYTGVDILDEMTESARKKHPDAKFVTADIFKSDIFEDTAFDVVYTSGIFNLNLNNNHIFFMQAIDKFIRISDDVIVFNLLHERSTAKENKYFYNNPEKIYNLMIEKFREVQIVDNYLENDFTVICRK